MDHDKLIRKLTENAAVTFEDAKMALESNDWDIIDAMLQLEDVGKVKSPDMKIYFTNDRNKSFSEIVACCEEKSWQYYENKDRKKYDERHEKTRSAFEKACKFIEKCNGVFIEIKRREGSVLRLPITVVALLLIFCYRIVIPLVIVALLCNVEFSIDGEALGGNGDDINSLFNRAHCKAEKVRNNIRAKMKKNGKYK
ncbi:hypothetical protein [Hathewaya proteolytica]|nr:hypothetical protein [Hathewaya proteolytica]